MKISLFILILCLNSLIGCDRDNEKEPTIYCSTFMPSGNNRDILFIPPDTSQACYSNLLEDIKTLQENAGPCSYPPQKLEVAPQNILESSEKLSFEEVELSIPLFCKEMISSYSLDQNQIVLSSFGFEDDDIIFYISHDDKTLEGRIISYQQGLSCPAYKVNCYIYGPPQASRRME